MDRAGDSRVATLFGGTAPLSEGVRLRFKEGLGIKGLEASIEGSALSAAEFAAGTWIGSEGGFGATGVGAGSGARAGSLEDPGLFASSPLALETKELHLAHGEHA